MKPSVCYRGSSKRLKSNATIEQRPEEERRGGSHLIVIVQDLKSVQWYHNKSP